MGRTSGAAELNRHDFVDQKLKKKKNFLFFFRFEINFLDAYQGQRHSFLGRASAGF